METGLLFIGSQSDCKAFIRKFECYYIYILRRPDGRPFYIGKGRGERVFHHENEARHANNRKSNAYKLNVIRAVLSAGGTISYEIDSFHEQEAAAHEREMQLIRAIGRLHEGGPLTNLAPGGGSERGASPSSKLRHSATLSGAPADNPERAAINTFVTGIAPMNSVVIKPASQFIAKATQRYPSKTMKPSLRQAVALAASAASNGVMLEGECTIPRRVVIDDVDGLIENGVSCDIVTSNLGSLVAAENPSDEHFILSPQQAKVIIALLGAQKCIDLGILRP